MLNYMVSQLKQLKYRSTQNVTLKKKQYDAKKKALHLVEPSDAISDIIRQFKQEVLGRLLPQTCSGCRIWRNKQRWVQKKTEVIYQKCTLKQKEHLDWWHGSVVLAVSRQQSFANVALLKKHIKWEEQFSNFESASVWNLNWTVCDSHVDLEQAAGVADKLCSAGSRWG